MSSTPSRYTGEPSWAPAIHAITPIERDATYATLGHHGHEHRISLLTIQRPSGPPLTLSEFKRHARSYQLEDPEAIYNSLIREVAAVIVVEFPPVLAPSGELLPGPVEFHSYSTIEHAQSDFNVMVFDYQCEEAPAP